MTQDDLLDKVYWHWRKDPRGDGLQPMVDYRRALLEVIRLHQPKTDEDVCILCSKTGFWIAYPCSTIQAIEKELS
jgi:hypothetical protein